MRRTIKAIPVAMLVSAGLLISISSSDTLAQSRAKERRDQASTHLFNQHAVEEAFAQEPGTNGGEGTISGPAQEQYDNRAYPATYIQPAQQQNAAQSFVAVKISSR